MWRRIALLVFLTACGGDDSNDPGSISIDGQWNASLSNMSGSGLTCSSTAPTQITLDQAGTNFAGSYSGGQLTCSGAGGSSSGAVGTGAIINGTISGSSVDFFLDTQDSHFVGTVNGNSMSGTATWQANLGPLVGTVTLNGNWTAAR